MKATADGLSKHSESTTREQPPHLALHILNWVWRPKLLCTIKRNCYYYNYPEYLQQARQDGTAIEALPARNYEPPRWEVMLNVFPGQLETYYSFVKQMVPHEQRIYYLQKSFLGWKMLAWPGLKKLEMAEVRVCVALAEQAATEESRGFTTVATIRPTAPMVRDDAMPSQADTDMLKGFFSTSGAQKSLETRWGSAAYDSQQLRWMSTNDVCEGSEDSEDEQ